MSDLADLIGRLESATGPDRQLDAEIVVAITPDVVGIEPTVMNKREWLFRFDPPRRWLESWLSVPAYTASLDAAVTLVPEGWAIASLEWWPMRQGGAGVALFETDSHGGYDREYCRDVRVGCCWTPALALCIAALRAREAGDGG